MPSPVAHEKIIVQRVTMGVACSPLCPHFEPDNGHEAYCVLFQANLTYWHLEVWLDHAGRCQKCLDAPAMLTPAHPQELAEAREAAERSLALADSDPALAMETHHLRTLLRHVRAQEQLEQAKHLHAKMDRLTAQQIERFGIAVDKLRAGCASAFDMLTITEVSPRLLSMLPAPVQPQALAEEELARAQNMAAERCFCSRIGDCPKGHFKGALLWKEAGPCDAWAAPWAKEGA